MTEMNENCVIKIENLSKEYRLGAIGSGTLRHDLQSWYAKKRGKEDPNQRIGAKQYTKDDTFLALDGVNLEVNRGERIGIIGANGAGKSTPCQPKYYLWNCTASDRKSGYQLSGTGCIYISWRRKTVWYSFFGLYIGDCGVNQLLAA